MLLSLNGKVSGTPVNLDGVMDSQVSIGVPGGEALLQFVDAVINNHDAIEFARNAVEDQLGSAAVVDAAGVIANFQRMPRSADCTGIPLDEPLAVVSHAIAEDLGITEYSSAGRNKLSFFQKLKSRLIQPFLGFMIKRTVSRRDKIK